MAAVIPHDESLRERIQLNLAAHTLYEVPHGEEKRAAVGIVVVASATGSDTVDPFAFTPEPGMP